MAVFTYTAMKADGRTVAGSVPADTRAAAISAIVGQGLNPLQVNEQNAPATATPRQTAGGGTVRSTHVESFTRELATLLAGGVPLSRALHLLEREATAPGPKQLWHEIHDDVVGGVSLADSLGRHPRVFSKVYVAMIRAGEAGGFLEVVLGQIADFRSREKDLTGRVKAAMVYPCVLGVLAIGVLVFLLTFFIPRFSGIFSEFGAALPALTRFILAASEVVTRYGLGVAVVVAFLVIMLRRAIATDTGRRRLDGTRHPRAARHAR
jgi:type II secretory pathway component PulF